MRFLSLAVAAACIAGFAADASAKHRKREHYRHGPAAHGSDCCGAEGFVVAESQFGSERVAGPVRPGKFGPEVRLPGGTWVECGRSCSETLRVQTIDFFDNQKLQNGGGGPASPGYFRWEYYY